MNISQNDRTILRNLAKKVSEVSSLPIMAERRNLWTRHNQLEKTRPVIMISPEGAWGELITHKDMNCEGEEARSIEWQLKSRIYAFENFHDDTVVEKSWIVHKKADGDFYIPWFAVTNWGVDTKHTYSETTRGAFGFDPVIKEPSDLKKLKAPVFTYNEKSTLKEYEDFQELFGDILDVQLKGVAHVSFHLMNNYIHMRGLEQVMWDMYDEPEMLHEAMEIFTRGYQSVINQCIEQNLFSLNNDYTYHSSGGFSYSNELPKPGFNPDRVRPCDMWASAEAQELAQVSPEMHAEFSLKYEKRLLSQFGLNGYGCCEDLTRKLDDVFTVPNMRRISISPWADVEKCADKLKGGYIFSWKPQPSHLVGEFNEEHIREYIKHTLDVTKGCVLEMILKDTHTCEFHPERFTRWTQIARELIDEYYG